MADRPRVFCIGWHKTGTTTLGLSLLRLGYSVVGCRLDLVHPLNRGDYTAVLDVAREFDAVQDVPWAALFRQLDECFPGSKFVLTVRDEESWLQSASRHFGSINIPLHEWIYGAGVLRGNEDLYLERFRSHYTAVKKYFSARPDDLLIMDLLAGDGWNKLCRFLEHPVPDQRFPHENKAHAKLRPGEGIVHVLRTAVPRRLRKALFRVRVAGRRIRGLGNPRDRFNNFHQNQLERSRWPECFEKENND